jgi:hypothetical protein
VNVPERLRAIIVSDMANYMSKPDSAAKPVDRMVMYRPKPGHQAALEAIVAQHGPVLRAVGLISDAPVRVYRASDLRKPEAGAFVVEHFQWRDAGASDLAHQLPEVMAVWESMGPHMEDMTLITLEALGEEG